MKLITARATCLTPQAENWVVGFSFSLERNDGRREYWAAELQIPENAVLSWSILPNKTIGSVAVWTPNGKKGSYKIHVVFHDRACRCCRRALREMGRDDVIELLHTASRSGLEALKF